MTARTRLAGAASRWRDWLAPGRLLLVLLAGAGLYLFSSDWVRVREGNAVLAVASWLSPAIQPSSTEAAAIVGRGTGAFAVTFSGSCSVAALVAAFVPLALLMPRVPFSRRLLALIAALVVVVVVNASRVIAVVLAGSRWGSQAMVLLHDLAGTLLYAAAGLAGLLVMVSITAAEPKRTASP